MAISFLALILALGHWPLHSTPVVIVPTKTGIVVAAETRQTVLDSMYCDGKTKILVSAHSRLAVGAITGNSTWVDFPGIPRDKVCEFVAQAAPAFDFAPIVAAFLEEHAISIARGDIEALRGRCVGALQAYFSDQPAMAGRTNPGELTQVLVATFDRKKRISSVWSFKILSNNSSSFTGGEVVVKTWRTVGHIWVSRYQRIRRAWLRNASG